MTRTHPTPYKQIMRHVTIALVALCLLDTPFLLAQTNNPGTSHVPQTSWGKPDLQGVWTNATLTPLERASSMEGRDVLTAEEVANLEQAADDRNERLLNEAAQRTDIGGNIGAYNNFWMDQGTRAVDGRRTALIVDPPNGQIPWTQTGRARFESDSARYGVGPYNSWVDADTGERCLTDGLPLLPLQGYNMNYHILQSDGWVAILNEMFHEYRMIPTDGRTHVPSHVGQWLGDARGRWEGNTLVVETKSFADKTVALWRWTWRGARPNLHLVERFTRIDNETMNYEFTMTDADMFTQPWSARVPMTTNQESRGVTAGPMYEYACHEGNYGLLNMLRGARSDDIAP